jgi:hypothetical protein
VLAGARNGKAVVPSPRQTASAPSFQLIGHLPGFSLAKSIYRQSRHQDAYSEWWQTHLDRQPSRQ